MILMLEIIVAKPEKKGDVWSTVLMITQFLWRFWDFNVLFLVQTAFEDGTKSRYTIAFI